MALESDPPSELLERFPRVAAVHEWLTVPGGSEKVLMAILDLLPQADVFTSVYDPAPWRDAMRGRRVTASALDRIPGARRRYMRLLPLMDPAFRSFDLRGYDLIVSSNHASAKNVRTPAGVPHVCYCHTPMRYAWDPSLLAGESLGPAAGRLLPILTAWLRHVDRRRATGPTTFVANSEFVAGRIRAAYGRDSVVIHPPVDIAPYLATPRRPADAYLVFGRIVPYKRVEIAVQACERLGRRLIVAGGGRALEAVRGFASANTEFIGHVPDADVPALLSRARALLFPGLEDFGIVPVEALAAGAPVIAFGEGGVRDSVVDGVTGVLYDPGTVEGMCAGLERFEALTLDEQAIRDSARRFGPERFAAAFRELLINLEVCRRPPG